MNLSRAKRRWAMTEGTRYWALAASTWLSTRLITGSPILATIAGFITCLTLSRDARQRTKP